MLNPLPFLLILSIFFAVTACQNLESVKPADRPTFMHFYGGVGNFRAVAAEPTGDGFILVGDSLPTSDVGIVIIKTDLFGNQVWRKNIPHGTASALKLVADGYLIIGDSIKVNPRAAQVNDQQIRKSRLIKLGADGLKKFDRSYGDTSTANAKRVDFSGNAFAIDGNTVITVNSVRNNNKNAGSMVTAMSLGNNTFDTLWSETYDLLSRDFVNSKSAHITTQGQVIWANTAILSSQLATRAYIELPVVKQGSQFDNKSPFGQLDGLFYSGNDIQPSGTGYYGVIGTFQTITGGNKNILFVQADMGGNFITGSEKFFDGVPSNAADINSITTGKTVSSTDDEGSALTATGDGGMLLGGTSLTSTSRGNGGTDIFIIRLDPFGNVLWNRIIGGRGDETVSTVRQTPDGGFLISGTLNLGELQSMYILKTDSKGNLQN